MQFLSSKRREKEQTSLQERERLVTRLEKRRGKRLDWNEGEIKDDSCPLLFVSRCLSPQKLMLSCPQLSHFILVPQHHSLVKCPVCLFSCSFYLGTNVCLYREHKFNCLNPKLSMHVCFPPWTLACLSSGQEDTGISRDELQIDEAVIEVFKKVRGD